MTGKNHRPFAFGDQFGRLLHVLHGRLFRRVVAKQLNFGRLLKLHLLDLGVLAEVDQHRARPAAAGDIEGLFDNLGHLAGAGYQEIVLGDGQCYAGHIGFLEGVAANKVGRHLPGDADDWRRVHHRRSDTGHQVRGSRPGGSNGHTHLAR